MKWHLFKCLVNSGNYAVTLCFHIITEVKKKNLKSHKPIKKLSFSSIFNMSTITALEPAVLSSAVLQVRELFAVSSRDPNQ